MTDRAVADERSGWLVRVARWACPAGVLLATLVFLLLPAVGAACGGTGPIGPCWAGRQVLTGTPSVDATRISADPSVLRSLVDTAAMPAGARVLAVLTLVVLAAGAFCAALPQPLARSAVTAACTLAGTLLFAATEIVATTGLAHNIRYIPGAFTTDPDADVDAIVSAGWGFWLALAVLVVATMIGVGVFDGTRRRVAEVEFRSPA